MCKSATCATCRMFPVPLLFYVMCYLFFSFFFEDMLLSLIMFRFEVYKIVSCVGKFDFLFIYLLWIYFLYFVFKLLLHFLQFHISSHPPPFHFNGSKYFLNMPNPSLFFYDLFRFQSPFGTSPQATTNPHIEKATWFGCGQHVPSVMDNVPTEERCSVCLPLCNAPF